MNRKVLFVLLLAVVMVLCLSLLGKRTDHKIIRAQTARADNLQVTIDDLRAELDKAQKPPALTWPEKQLILARTIDVTEQLTRAGLPPIVAYNEACARVTGGNPGLDTDLMEFEEGTQLTLGAGYYRIRVYHKGGYR